MKSTPLRNFFIANAEKTVKKENIFKDTECGNTHIFNKNRTHKKSMKVKSTVMLNLGSKIPDPKQLGTCYSDFMVLQNNRAGKDI